MSEFIIFLRGCSRDDLLGLPLKLMSTEELAELRQEITRRNNEQLKQVKRRITLCQTTNYVNSIRK